MNKVQMLKHSLALLLLCAVVTSCGFHLKGNNSIVGTLKEIHLSGKHSHGDTAMAIKTQAQKNGIALNSKATWTIMLEQESNNERRLTSTQSVSLDEFMLSLDVTFYLSEQSAQSDKTYGPIKIRRETIFQGDEKQAASKDNEKQLLLAELREQIANQILRQAQIISNNPPDCNCENETQSPTASQ